MNESTVKGRKGLKLKSEGKKWNTLSTPLFNDSTMEIKRELDSNVQYSNDNGRLSFCIHGEEMKGESEWVNQQQQSMKNTNQE